MKNDLPFFSHFNDARNHPKMKALRAQYGVAGYGLFWMLNEMIAAAKDARLDLSKKIYRTATAGELGMNLDEFDSFLAFLSDPEYDLVNYKDGILTTDQTQKDYSLVQGKRERDKTRYLGNSGSVVENVDSANENANSASGNDTQHSTAHNRTIQQQHAREGLPVDKSEEASLAAFALERAKKTKGVRNLEPYAASLMREPDVIAAWREALRNPPPPPEPKLPPPGDCPSCGGERMRYPGDTYDVRTCTRCGAKAHWDADWKIWGQADEQSHAFEDSA